MKATETAPDAEAKRQRDTHAYLSTACLHAVADGRSELHGHCSAMVGYQGAKRPGTCKFCDAKCTCGCHSSSGSSSQS